MLRRRPPRGPRIGPRRRLRGPGGPLEHRTRREWVTAWLPSWRAAWLPSWRAAWRPSSPEPSWPEPSSSRRARESGGLHVLVLGGSQGAEALNERAPAALGARRRRRARRGSRWSTRRAKVATRRSRGLTRGSGSDGWLRVVPFSTTLAADLAWADLVVARAGAGTIAEMAAVGRRSCSSRSRTPPTTTRRGTRLRYADRRRRVGAGRTAADATRIAEEVRRILVDEALRSRRASRARMQGTPGGRADDRQGLLRLHRRCA